MPRAKSLLSQVNREIQQVGQYLYSLTQLRNTIQTSGFITQQQQQTQSPLASNPQQMRRMRQPQYQFSPIQQQFSPEQPQQNGGRKRGRWNKQKSEQSQNFSTIGQTMREDGRVNINSTTGSQLFHAGIVDQNGEPISQFQEAE